MLTEVYRNMIVDHVDQQIYFVEPGKKVDYTQLFDKHLLEATTPLEHLCVFERALNMSIVCGEVDDLEIVGVNDEGRTLYRRLD